MTFFFFGGRAFSSFMQSCDGNITTFPFLVSVKWPPPPSQYSSKPLDVLAPSRQGRRLLPGLASVPPAAEKLKIDSPRTEQQRNKQRANYIPSNMVIAHGQKLTEKRRIPSTAANTAQIEKKKRKHIWRLQEQSLKSFFLKVFFFVFSSSWVQAFSI